METKIVVGLRNASEGVNPKDRVGSNKTDLSLVPNHALREVTKALEEGARKYGAYNWRVEPIQFRTYLAACARHLGACLDGEDVDPDSGLHPLTHVAASCLIVLDALNFGSLIDNRPIPKPQPADAEECHQETERHSS